MTRNLTAAGPGSTEPSIPTPGEAWPGRRVRHGTPSGYRLHQEEESEPCSACAQAKAHYDWRWRNGDLPTKKNRLRAAAQNYAKTDLVRAHRDEYDEYYYAHIERLFEEAGIPAPKRGKKRNG